jgi:ABC-type polysaccharide/polyol phosphate export permease
MFGKLRDLWAHRELLWNMTVKELKVKYKRSVLGFVWSFVTPMIMLAVFSLVFAILAKGSNMSWFAVYLMCCLLPWLFFVNSLMQSVGSVTIKKVYFPRVLLPIAAVGANIFHFVMQMLVFFIFLLIIQWHFSIYLLFFPLVLLLEIVFALGMALFVSAANVYLRDVQHFVEVATMAWFWLTPIVYTMATLTGVAGSYTWIYLLNPMANIVMLWQYIIYNPYKYGPSAAYLSFWGILYTAVGSLILLFAAYYYFTRSERGFAEQI